MLRIAVELLVEMMAGLLMELSRAITESFMRDFLEAMEVEMSRYNLDFVVWIEMEVTLFPIKVPAPGQKQSGEFGWANNKYRG